MRGKDGAVVGRIRCECSASYRRRGGAACVGRATEMPIGGTMKQVIEQYAATVIAMMVAGVLLIFCFGLHAWQSDVLSDLLQIPEHDDTVFYAYMDREAPTLVQTRPCVVRVNEEVILSDYFRATDASGNLLEVCFAEIWEEKSELVEMCDKVPDEFGPDASKVSVSERGVYRMEVYATDGERTTRRITYVLVNER